MWGSDRERCAANCVPTSLVGEKCSNNVFGGETELLKNQNHVPTSVVCAKSSNNVFGGETELLNNQNVQKNSPKMSLEEKWNLLKIKFRR